MNEDGHLDIVHSPARKAPGPPVIFLGDGKGNWRRWSEAKFPRLPYDYGDAAVGDFNGDGHPDIALGVHLRGLLALTGRRQGGLQGRLARGSTSCSPARAGSPATRRGRSRSPTGTTTAARTSWRWARGRA